MASIHYVLAERLGVGELSGDMPWTLIVERPITSDIDRLYAFYNRSLLAFLVLLPRRL